MRAYQVHEIDIEGDMIDGEVETEIERENMHRNEIKPEIIRKFEGKFSLLVE